MSYSIIGRAFYCVSNYVIGLFICTLYVIKKNSTSIFNVRKELQDLLNNITFKVDVRKMIDPIEI